MSIGDHDRSDDYRRYSGNQIDILDFGFVNEDRPAAIITSDDLDNVPENTESATTP